MMKSKSIFLSLCTVLICACSAEGIDGVDSSSKRTSYFENTSEAKMYCFTNESEFESTVTLLSSIDDEKEKTEWVKKHLGSIKSLRDVYDEAMVEAESLTETKQSSMEFKNKYSKYLFFADYKDDGGFYLPVKDLNVACLLNPNGDVKIAGKIVNKKDVTSYSQLQAIGVALYSLPNMMRTRATAQEFAINRSGNNSIGEEYDSGWKHYGGKKVKLKARRRTKLVNGNALLSCFHTEFCFRKKTWLGWTNYRSESTIKGRVSWGDGGFDLNSHETAHSSHDKDYPLPIYWDSRFTYTYPELTCTADVDYRGVHETLHFNWEMNGAYCKLNTIQEIYIFPLVK